VTATINRLRTILGSRKLLMDIVVRELRAIQEKYSDARRTEIIDDSGRDPDRGPDRGRRCRHHGEQHRLHQAHVPFDLPQPAPRRKGPVGHGAQGRYIVSHLFVASTHA